MKTITVKLSDAQAARIESIAGMIGIEPGELITILTFEDLDGWDTQEHEAFIGLSDSFNRWVKRGEAPGKATEAELRRTRLFPCRKKKAA